MRDKTILKFWDRNNMLNLKNKQYRKAVKKYISGKLKEDLGKGDITTQSLIDKDKKITARVIAKQDGIVAGIEEGETKVGKLAVIH